MGTFPLNIRMLMFDFSPHIDILTEYVLLSSVYCCLYCGCNCSHCTHTNITDKYSDDDFICPFIFIMKEMKLQIFSCENAISRMELSFVNSSLCLVTCEIQCDDASICEEYTGICATGKCFMLFRCTTDESKRRERERVRRRERELVSNEKA